MTSPQEASYMSADSTSALQPPVPMVSNNNMPLTSEPSPMSTADLQTASSPPKSKAFFCNDRHHNSGYGRLPISHSHSHEPRVPGHEESLVPGLHKQWSR